LARDTLNELFELASHAYLAYKHATMEEKGELLKTLSSNRTLNGKVLTITLKKSFQLIANRFECVGGCASLLTDACNVKQLEGFDPARYRLRVGNWRIHL
jgi:hypothetical protein